MEGYVIDAVRDSTLDDLKLGRFIEIDQTGIEAPRCWPSGWTKPRRLDKSRND